MSTNITLADGVMWKANQLWQGAGTDMIKRANAIAEISKTISLSPSDYMRGEWVKKLAKEFGMSRKDFETQVRSHALNAADAEVDDERLFKLPEGVDPNFVAQWGFYELKNGPKKTGYWFDLGREKRALEVSNFVVTPLFHLFSPVKEMNKRMIEIDNGYAAKTVEILSRRMISLEGFAADVYDEGHYLFSGNKGHLTRLNDFWGDKFPICFELTNLGWQKEGFFAYSDRIFNGELLPYNEYGIIRHNDQHFYSPGANKKRSERRGDVGKFDADHQLAYLKSDVTWEQWCQMMAEVYPDHYMAAIATVCASLCRDIILEFSNNFPLLYCYGERQSGKSEFALSIMHCFVNDAKMFNLNSGTDAAFFTFISRYVNCFVGLNEFDDKDVRPEWFQAIKGFFDIEGRKRNIDKHKMEEQPINCMAGLCGQYLSTKDDNSVVSRSWLCQFQAKPNRSQEEMQRFQKLVDIQKSGMNGVIIDVLRMRQDTLKGGALKDLFDETLKELRTVFKERELRWEDRPGRNYALMITMCKWAAQNWKMPYTIDMAKEYAMGRVLDVVNIMHTTDVLMEFWQTLSMLADKGDLQQGWHYKIKTVSNRVAKKKGKEIILGEDAPRNVVMLRLDICHREYMKEYGRVSKTVMNKTSLANYFLNRDYWLGTLDGEWFAAKDEKTGKRKNTLTSVYVFDYDVLEKMGVYLDFDPEAKAKEYNEETPEQAEKEPQEGLPF